MKFSISREALLKPLQLVAGVVERRQTLPVLSNVLVKVNESMLTLVGTDMEVELVARVSMDNIGERGETTLPARKLLDICRSLPEGANINVATEGSKATLRSGKSRFTLATLPANDFPTVEDSPSAHELVISQESLIKLIDSTAFSMAQQDVRYYLNGMLIELQSGQVRTVATDGHRLAMCTLPSSTQTSSIVHAILPRKAVIEIRRLLDGNGEVKVVIGSNHARVNLNDFVFTSKLVDGKFPDYDRVLPRGGNKVITADRALLRQALSRTAILSNEKYRGVRLQLSQGTLTAIANNPEQEEAEEQVVVDYPGDALEVGFNVNYLQDVLGALSGERVRMTLTDANSSMLIEAADSGDAVYVVMPMRL